VTAAVRILAALADDRHLPDATDRFERRTDLLVGELRDVADGRTRSPKRRVQDRRRPRVDLDHGGRLDAVGQIAQDRVEPAADVLRGDVDVTVTVVKINPQAQIVFNGTQQIGAKGEERTLVRFVLNADGDVTDVNTQPKPLVLRSSI